MTRQVQSSTGTWIVQEDEREDVSAILKESGAELPARVGFEPLSTILFVGTAVVIARGLTAWLRDVRGRGVVVDLTKDPFEIRPMAGWDRNHVLILTATGPVFHEFDGTDESLLSLITGLI